VYGGEEKYKISVRKPQGKKLLHRPRCRSEDNREAGSDCIDWIEMTQDRAQWQTFVNMVMNLLDA
jgi:hypothetical protein